MARLFVPLFIALALVAGLLLWLDPTPTQATPPPPSTPGYRLNSEGDEWIKESPDRVKPKPPAPAVIQQGETESGPPGIPPAVLPAPDTQLGIALDQAREAGPQAVLAFVAGQPDPHLPLLEAAAWDARNELSAAEQNLPVAPNAVNRVSLNSGPCAFLTVQEAVNASVNGDTVRVAAGPYTETIDISGGKVITIEGGYDSACTSLILGLTQIKANAPGSVVDLTGGSVLTLRNLDLTGGTSFGAGVDLLGSSRVTLINTDVHDNAGASGGGIYIGSGSIVTFTTDSDIYNNTATGGGGAIVYGALRGFDSSSDIYQNSASDGGGLYISGGTVLLDNADVVANTASNRGGGIYAVTGVITLTNSVFVGETAPCCQTAVTGGGIYASASRITLLGTANAVMNNTASDLGGGLYLAGGSILTTTGGSLGYDTSAAAGNEAVFGAGLYAITSTVNFAGRIVNNIASNSGGGLYATNSVINLNNATIGGLAANQHNQIGPTGLNGAGLYLINNSRATMDNTVIVSNTLSNLSTGYGGGIYVRQGSVITMTNSRIERHSLPSSFDGRGAALYIQDATVTLSNTQVISNTTNNLGAGARMFGTSTLNILGGSSFVNNKALGGIGGAIAATSTPDINVTNASFRSNFASTDGGAIYLDAGTLDFTGQWDVRFNTAARNGGAVAVLGTGNTNFSVTAGPDISLLAVNHAGSHGGALYVTNNNTVELHATNGFLLAINTNSAGGNGGAGYADGGALFDVYGKIQATSNNAAGNGGLFYLSNGSRLWIDDFFNDFAQILVNQAANGGAIYASNSPRVECDGVEFGFSNNGNKATAGSGGAIYLSGSTFLADNCSFHNNQAQAGNGGAIAAFTSTLAIDTDYPAGLSLQDRIEDRLSPAAPQATACNPLSRQCSSLYANTAISSTVSNGYGGAIFTRDSNLSVNSTYLHRNRAVRGGAIYQEGASAIGNIANTLVYSNTSLQAFGAGIRVAGGAITITHSTLANNIGGAGFSPGSAQSYIYNAILWGNSTASFNLLTAAVCNIDQGGTAGPAINPMFASPGAGENYRLRQGSPAIDACSSGLPRDLLNVARPIAGKYDMGVFEMLIQLFMPAVRG